MRAWLPVVLALPLALAGCPALLSDWSIVADRNEVDASHDAAGLGSGSGASSGSTGGSSSGGSSGSSSGGSLASTGGSDATGGSSTGGAPSSTGGAPVVDACALVTHDNGLGQTWQDCVPLYTYNTEQAMKACKVSDAVICIENTRCGFHEVQGFNADRSALIGEWGYEAYATGYVYPPGVGICTTNPARRIWT